jgi:hypothetical protein
VLFPVQHYGVDVQPTAKIPPSDLLTTVPALFRRLIDDAALFPPGNATMQDAVRQHLQGKVGRHADITGLFLCPAARVEELVQELEAAAPASPIELSLVVDADLSGFRDALALLRSHRALARLQMVEMAAPTTVDSSWLVDAGQVIPAGVVKVVEPQRPPGDIAREQSGWLHSVRRVAEHGYWPKLRCGGLTADAFPSNDQVAEFLRVTCALQVPFKATAGLHHAAHYTDRGTGFDHHGFLNLLLAVAQILRGQSPLTALSNTDGRALAREAKAMSDQLTNAVRARMASYGSCSLAEPLADLADLGLL